MIDQSNEATGLLSHVSNDNHLSPRSMRSIQKHHSKTNRLLNSRHISMIAIGGIIGTGLFIGIRNTLVNGPWLSLLSYCYVSILCYIVIMTVGEMSCFLPINGSLCQFQFQFLSKSIGLSINLIYWLSWSITLALELSLIYTIISWWHDFQYPTMITFAFWLLFLISNLLPVNNYGEIESFITIIKIGFIITWIIISIIFILKSEIGFKYWHDANHSFPTFYNLTSSLISACFTFQSIESVAICSGEIKNPEINIPKSIKYVMVRIIVFYIGSLFLLTLMISSQDPRLGGNGSESDIFQSPFLIGLINCGFPTSSIVLSLFNLVILILIMSAANSNVYFGSRCLISITESGYLPNFILKTANGVPYIAVILTSTVGLLSLLLKYKSVETVFNLLIKLCSTAGLLMWIFILLSYLRFRKILDHNHIEYQSLPYKSKYPKLMINLAYFGIINVSLIVLLNGLPNFYNLEWDDLISSYLTVTILLSLIIGFKLYWNEPWLIPLDQIVLPSTYTLCRTGVSK